MSFNECVIVNKKVKLVVKEKKCYEWVLWTQMQRSETELASWKAVYFHGTAQVVDRCKGQTGRQANRWAGGQAGAQTGWQVGFYDYMYNMEHRITSEAKALWSLLVME